MPETSNTPTNVSDSGMEFGGGGGMFDFEGLGNMINSGITTFHRETLNKQQMRGNDPCLYWAAQEELYYNVIQEAVEKANGVAAKTSSLLITALRQNYRYRGYPSTKYAGGKDLGLYMGEQLGLDSLIPAPMLVATGIAFGMSGGAAGPFIAGGISDFIKDHLPRWQDIDENRIPVNGKGVEIANGVFLWGEGLPVTPTTTSEKNQLYNSGAAKYRGQPVADVIADWRAYQREEVVPPQYLSARTKLIDLVGTWEGSGDYGIWRPGDPITSTSQVGEINWVKQDLFAGRDEAKALCNSLRQQGIDLTQGDIESEQKRKMVAIIGAIAVGIIAANRL